MLPRNDILNSSVKAVEGVGIEEFPAIETFQRLPKKVIVKGGESTLTKTGSAELVGIVINNLGQPIRNVQVHLVIFDRHEIPILTITTTPNPDRLPQGGIGSFKYTVENHFEPIAHYYLYAQWLYDDSE